MQPLIRHRIYAIMYLDSGGKMTRSAKEMDLHVCPYQIAFILDNWIRRLLQPPTRVVGEYIRPGNTVIDIGCGPGFFTIDMAKMVGRDGEVIAVDLQEPMLDKVRKKSSKHGVDGRIKYHLCGKDGIGLNKEADFILAYYMVHETPDPARFLREVRQLLKPDGKLLVVEPKMHVGRRSFETMVEKAGEAGLVVLGYPGRKGGRGVLFGRTSTP